MQSQAGPQAPWRRSPLDPGLWDCGRADVLVVHCGRPGLGLPRVGLMMGREEAMPWRREENGGVRVGQESRVHPTGEKGRTFKPSREWSGGLHCTHLTDWRVRSRGTPKLDLAPNTVFHSATFPRSASTRLGHICPATPLSLGSECSGNDTKPVPFLSLRDMGERSLWPPRRGVQLPKSAVPGLSSLCCAAVSHLPDGTLPPGLLQGQGRSGELGRPPLDGPWPAHRVPLGLLMALAQQAPQHQLPLRAPCFLLLAPQGKVNGCQRVTHQPASQSRPPLQRAPTPHLNSPTDTPIPPQTPQPAYRHPNSPTGTDPHRH